MKLHRGTGRGTGRGLAICDGATIVAVVRGDGYPLGIGNGPRSEALANLFTAAPDLLDAAKAFLDELNSTGDYANWERVKAQLADAVAAATAATFAPTMALALQNRTRGLGAWSHTEQERQNIASARRNGAGLRIKFRDGSVAFVPKGTAEVRVAA